MDEITLTNESLPLLSKDLLLEEDAVNELLNAPYERLIMWLEKRIAYLLDHDLAGLLQALYRVDIPEKRVKQLLNESPPDGLAMAITRAILDRERQKVETRMRYRSQ